MKYCLRIVVAFRRNDSLTAVAGGFVFDALRDWTFRAAEIRLAEHGELRRALELQAVPDHSTLFRFMLRLDERVIERVLAEVVRRLRSARSRPSDEKSTVAVDATGLAPGAISTFLFGGASTMVAQPRRIVAGSNGSWLSIPVGASSWAQKAHHGPTNDCATLPSLLEQVDKGQSLIGTVVADAEFDSERNHRYVREQLGAESIIPPKRSKPSWKITGVRAQMRVAFPAERYRQRVHAETIFSAIKRKLSARAPGRSLLTQRKQALLLGLAYNIYKLWPPRLRTVCP